MLAVINATEARKKKKKCCRGKKNETKLGNRRMNSGEARKGLTKKTVCKQRFEGREG